MLRNAKPEALITPGARSLADWVKEGRRVFRELDIPYLRSYDPKFVEILRDVEKYRRWEVIREKMAQSLSFVEI